MGFAEGKGRVAPWFPIGPVDAPRMVLITSEVDDLHYAFIEGKISLPTLEDALASVLRGQQVTVDLGAFQV